MLFLLPLAKKAKIELKDVTITVNENVKVVRIGFVRSVDFSQTVSAQ